MLQGKGYATGVYGHWHLGLTWKDGNGGVIRSGGLAGVRKIDYAQKQS